MMQASKEMKTIIEPGLSDVLLELFAANREVGIHVTLELCQRTLNRLEMPIKWAEA